MRTQIWVLDTPQEHGRSAERLRRAAARTLGVPESDSRLRPERTARGQLYFPLAPGLHCSVSHSGGVWLCAVSDRPVGIDLQQHVSAPTERIAARFFCPEEAAWLKGRDAFFDLWCAKESYLKYLGEGLPHGLDRISLVSGGALRTELDGVPIRLLPFRPGYSLCLCGGGEPAFSKLEESEP